MTGFEYDHVGDALFCQLQRSVDTGKAAADDHHVGVNIILQRRKMQLIFFSGAVVVQRIDFDIHSVTLSVSPG